MQRYWLRALSIVVASLALQAARKDFWEIKDASSWSNEEKEILLVQSPWAREGSARMEVEKQKRTGPGYGNNGSRSGDMPDLKPGAGQGTQRTVQIGGEIPPVPNSDPGAPVQFRVLARWETAKPVRLAGAPEMPQGTEQFYVIRLRGLPLMPPPKVKPGEVAPNPNEGMLAAIKEGSSLERQNKPAIRCAHLFMGSGANTNEVLLFFPRGGDASITAADKLVTLESRFAVFHLSIKFPLKEMLYKGELSL